VSSNTTNNNKEHLGSRQPKQTTTATTRKRKQVQQQTAHERKEGLIPEHWRTFKRRKGEGLIPKQKWGTLNKERWQQVTT
jgi:hypothetical protein